MHIRPVFQGRDTPPIWIPDPRPLSDLAQSPTVRPTARSMRVPRHGTERFLRETCSFTVGFNLASFDNGRRKLLEAITRQLTAECESKTQQQPRLGKEAHGAPSSFDSIHFQSNSSRWRRSGDMMTLASRNRLSLYRTAGAFSHDTKLVSKIGLDGRLMCVLHIDTFPAMLGDRALRQQGETGERSARLAEH